MKIPKELIHKQGNDKIIRLGDMIKYALNKAGIDCEKQKWLPPGCKDRQKKLNRLGLRLE